ncbi:MAG: hypothetical protein FJY80_07080, partial [Candidatus Aminicenantes bacterium]|nr:hypothetical protein [Candidatus Aminicenantes bacterium]
MFQGGMNQVKHHPHPEGRTRLEEAGSRVERFHEKENTARMRKISYALLATVLLASLAAAQVPTGRIIGKATDEQNVPLPGVVVNATSSRMVGVASTVTDETGTFRLLSLPSGTYTITFTLQGFQPLKREGVVLQMEQTLTLNVSLVQSALAEEITVVGQSPLIDVKSTTKGSTMTKEVFMQLPRNRSFDGLLATVPGVQYESNQGGLSVDGASGTENVWYVDGTNVTSVHVGLRTQSVVMEQLEEVKVTASGYNAEFGGSMGGVVSVISRSGGNEFHGEIFGYYNNNRLWMEGKSRDSLRLNPYWTSPLGPEDIEYFNSDDLYYNGGKDRDDYQRMEGVFNLGGYILKDRLWFFASFNPTYSRTYGDRWFSTDPVDLGAAKVPGDTIADPRQGRPVYNFYSKYRYYYWQAKLTAQPVKGMRVSASAVSNYYNYRGSIPGITGTSAKNYPWNASWENTVLNGKEPGFSYPNLSGNLTMDWTLSNNFLVSLRGGYQRTNATDQQLKMPGTRYSFSASNLSTTAFPEIPDSHRRASGWTNWSATMYEYKKWIYGRASVNLDMTYYMNLAGEHAWKFGLQFIRPFEDVDASTSHPWVALAWGTYYTWPTGARVQGKYGYYMIRGDWVSPYGNFWTLHSDNWALYLQDSWTIGDRLTLNLGLRTESEYVPAMTKDTTLPGYKAKPIQFGFDQKLAPRLGVVYDVFGDSSLKVFASYGVYYDVMKLYMAEGAYGGFKWQTSYYTLEDWDFYKIAASGEISNKADQAAGGTYFGSRNWRTGSFEETEPDMKPVGQSEMSFGAEKKVTEELSFSARFVYKSIIRTIEDIGYLDADYHEQYFIGNPGEGLARPVSQGGIFSDKYWPAPKPKREYLGLNLALDKRFSNNWQGGVSYTWSRMWGNYGGLSSSDEGGRNSPNVERYWDLWFERYDLRGRPLDGILPSDRSHYFKAYGSYAFPFGLTVGLVGYGRSGLPRTTNLSFNDMQIFPDGYYDTKQRLPFTAWADLYVEYNVRIFGKYKVNLNATFSNITNTKTIQGYYQRYNYTMLRLTDDEMLAQKTNYKDWKTLVAEKVTVNPLDPRFNMWTSRYGTW